MKIMYFMIFYNYFTNYFFHVDFVDEQYLHSHLHLAASACLCKDYVMMTRLTAQKSPKLPPGVTHTHSCRLGTGRSGCVNSTSMGHHMVHACTSLAFTPRPGQAGNSMMSAA